MDDRPVTLDEVRKALIEPPPRVVGDDDRGRAAVALVLREPPTGPEILFIERSERHGDPWSGHMAFPGGRMDPGDPTPQAAAERETREEVGLVVGPDALLGRLDDLEGRHAGRRIPLVISAFVYGVPPDAGPLTPNYEVREALWVPVRELVVPERHVHHPRAGRDRGVRYPGVRVGDPDRHIVWGLTYRFLENLLERLGRPLPDRWDDFR